MKYIKTFENIKSYDLKKYFVTEKEIDESYGVKEKMLYVIFEILNKKVVYDNKKITYYYDIQRKYYCKENNITEQKTKFLNDELKNKEIIYTSDNLDECLEFVKLKMIANKYNVI